MDLNLQIKPRADDALLASYSCPCGCNPRVAYRRGDEPVIDDCCCGNRFAVGGHAAHRLEPREGFTLLSQPFDAPWGESLQAAWTIGPSVDPNGGHDEGHTHGHAHQPEPASAEEAAPGTAIDPVCGMTVEIAAAVDKGLHLSYAGRDYYFCGRGCKLEFGDDPEKYLDPSYVPSM
ncbi:MAG TPA: YHS domain-containing protein [Candidatus Limnocylindrales bacterium]|jgi:YHS domain-containing protein|nr:YHS domain-containing protein [Candidatus Limnocylindrales bacterium]